MGDKNADNYKLDILYTKFMQFTEWFLLFKQLSLSKELQLYT